MSVLPTRLRKIVLTALRSSWLRPLNDARVWDELLTRLNPMWSFGRAHARVLAIEAETPTTKTIVLHARSNARYLRAGQYVGVDVEIDGARHRRSYSLSAAPDGRRLRITVKRQPGSRVSAWLHDRLRPGMALALTPATGDFGLPANATDDLLLLSAGSGITPMMAVLEQLARHRHGGNIAFVHSCRDEGELIFATRLRELAARMPNVSLHIHYSAHAGRIDAGLLARWVPDFAQRTTLLCGPAPFMQWVRHAYEATGAIDNLVEERFGVASLLHAEHAAGIADVTCLKSGRQFVSNGDKPLLMAAEDAGLQPKYGCRAGICRTCLCRKQSGTVENLLTGVTSDTPDQWIQLCISVARSNVELDL